MPLILSTAYFAPIQYFSKLIEADDIVLERYEHYPKQTYRNRCIILGANGPQVLTVPVTKGSELKVYTRDIRIDNSMNWRKIHCKAIESAYRCSPFYQYYADEVMPLLELKKEFLYDFNQAILGEMCSILEIQLKYSETNEYLKLLPSETIIDYRDAIHPKPRMKKEDASFVPPIYHQVFETKFDFIPNLSILDLLFNTGPESFNHLRNCVK